MKTLELAIYGDIGENFWTGEGITAKSITEKIKAAGKFDAIDLRINSPGGSVFDGVAIYNILRAQEKPVRAYIDGVAASIASIIAMAGDTRTMGAGAMMMVHDPLMMTIGNAAELREAAETLDKAASSMADIYVSRAGMSAEEARAIMAAETWMTAAEAVAKGFATHQASEGDAKALAAARSFPLLAKLKNVPEALRPSGEPEGPESTAARTEPEVDESKLARERFKITHQRRTA